MTISTEAIATLLIEAEQAHGEYETSELNGVYDEDWARWYAAYAVEHGIGDLLGREIATDELAMVLATGYTEYEQSDPKPSEEWAAWTARRLATEL
jgi:hypothetical protein